MREANRSGTNIRDLKEKRIGMKGETINRGKKKEEVEQRTSTSASRGRKKRKK
jgi:hypothetical protein